MTTAFTTRPATSLLTLLFAVTLSVALAQTPERLTDINSATVSSAPFHLKVYNDEVLFFAKTPSSSTNSLWKTDGTNAGTVKVTSLLEYSHYPSSGDFSTTLNGIHYYQSGGRLIRTNGTEEGTSVVKDFGVSYATMYETGGKIFIMISPATYVGELWVSDGSAANTTKIKTFDDPPPFEGVQFNRMENIRLHEGEIFFTVQTSLSGGCCGQELWKSDGTSDGTVSLDADAAFHYSFIFQNSLFFFRPDGLRKASLTATGETLIKTLPNYGNLTLFQAVASGSFMYFVLGETTSTPASTQEALWRTDGTDAGTIKLFTSDAGSPISSLTDVNGSVYFTSGYKLAKSVGSVAGTSVVKDFTIDAVAVPIYPTSLVAVGSKVFFSAFTLTGGAELWTSDGINTQSVASPESASARSLSPANIVRLGTKVLFTGTGEFSGTELFSSDGTVVSVVKDIDSRPGGSSISKITPGRTKVYFTATNNASETELWQTDGTTDGESLVNDITLRGSSNPLELIALKGDTLLYTAYNGSKRNLYSTASSTPLLMIGGSDNGTYLFPKKIDDAIYFGAFDIVHGQELMKTDVATTQRLTDLAAGNNGSLSYNYPTKLKDDVYFFLNDYLQNVNSGLYKVDATTPSGASLVKAFTIMGPFFAHDGFIYFYAHEPSTGMELWKTDGTTAGTVLIKDINPGPAGSFPNSVLDSEENLTGPVTFNGKLYFTPYIGSTAHIWATDGTEAGTVNTIPVNASRLTVTGGRLFFAGPDGVYSSDGTEEGTVSVASASDPYAFHAFNNHLVYSQSNNLRITDGSVQGTQTLATFTGSYVGWTKHSGNTLYFSADDGINGQELWKLTLPDAPVISAFAQDATDQTKFIISGSNFTTTSAVFFGGTAATSFTVISDSQIEATIANAEASGVVRVNTKGGSATKSGFSFTPIPAVTSFAPAIGVTGSKIIITGSNFTGVTSVTFGGVSAASFVINSDSEIEAVVGADAKSGEVSVSRSGQVGSLTGFTFYGQPVIESLSPSIATRGTEVIVTGKNFYQVSSVHIGNVSVSNFTAPSTQQVKIFVPSTAVSGALKIIAASGTVTTDLVVDIPVGVEEVNASALDFYPNPVEGILRIDYSGELAGDATIRVLDCRGVTQPGIRMEYARSGWDADMSSLPAGLYILCLNQRGEQPKVFKVFKK